MYNRYIPEQERYTPVEERRSTPPPPGAARPGRNPLPWNASQLQGLMKRLHLDTIDIDSGDVLLILILLLLWKEGENKDLLLALAGAFLMENREDT